MPISACTAWPSIGIEDSLPVFTEGTKPDVLDQFALRSIAVITAAPLGSSDGMPSRGPIHAAVEPGLFDEGFDETEITVILMLPVLGQSLSHQGEDMGAEIGNTGPGQDQEPAVVAHPWQVFLALLCAPSDEVIPGGELPGGGTEAEQGQGNEAAAVVDRIAHLCTHQGLKAEVMIRAIYSFQR